MGCTSSSPELAAQRAVDDQITKELEARRKAMQKETKLLLLGASGWPPPPFFFCNSFSGCSPLGPELAAPRGAQY